MLFSYKENNKGGCFEVIEIDDLFFLKNDKLAFANLPSYGKSLGFIKNPNKSISYQEFIQRWRNGEKYRTEILNEASPVLYPTSEL